MLVYFNTAGWVANIALILNLLFTIGILAALGATLTAAGIAGLVLTIGLAVDTNVIIFERIKEELTRGKNYQLAVNDGYKRSYAPVLDAHVTVLMTAVILFYFGLGPVLRFCYHANTGYPVIVVLRYPYISPGFRLVHQQKPPLRIFYRYQPQSI